MSVRVHSSWLRGAVLAVSLGLLGVTGQAADDGAPVLPDAFYPKMVTYASKGIQDALKGSPKEEQVGKARTAAVMIAAYAQQNLSGADGQLRATVRDAALKVAKTIDAGKLDEAKKLAAELPTLKADAKAKKEKVALEDQIPLKSLMNQFNHPPEGGWGIHREFYAFQLGMKSSIPAVELNEKLTLKAYQVAVTADLLSARTPKKNQKEWTTWTADLRKGGVELADAVKAKDGKAGLEAIAKVTTSCTSCHKAFGGGPK